ncbi:MAG TPA: hypothetical protein VKW76_14210 [Candidatus Binatia bacterium]|nr:hypothetical protein [Candidatus Binatia bacterium]
MTKRLTGLGAVAVLVCGIGLLGSSALAKCPGVCRKTLAHELVACKRACGRGKAANACRKACTADHLSGLRACKAAVNPTPPGCSPSGAFLD